ncbi:TetR family transcriptional regulator [Fulvimonas soli]|uniref:TetR family transcriptional regulator n=2 Tax=Fulvimonas soli TaxID=155197 RepID=A0A316IER2_9GAMM|nr:TetR family transcriptional regulator [Fulvimonas soli]
MSARPRRTEKAAMKTAKKALPSRMEVALSTVQTNKQGQSLGPKGHATRLRLMRAAETLLKTRSPVELTAVSIAKASKTSSATFYMYFDDIRDILAALSDVAGHEMSDALAVLDEPWLPDALENRAQQLVEAFYKVWDAHREVLRYRNMEADRGDPRFEKLRMDVYVPFVELLAQRLIALCPADRKMSRGDARAFASVLHAAMERMATTDPNIVNKGLGARRLKAAQARIIAHAIASVCAQPEPLPKD